MGAFGWGAFGTGWFLDGEFLDGAYVSPPHCLHYYEVISTNNNLAEFLMYLCQIITIILLSFYHFPADILFIILIIPIKWKWPLFTLKKMYPSDLIKGFNCLLVFSLYLLSWSYHKNKLISQCAKASGHKWKKIWKNICFIFCLELPMTKIW